MSEPELAIEPEVVSEIVEYAPVESVENQVAPQEVEVEAEIPAKPVHVYQKPTDEYLEPPEEKHRIRIGWSNRATH